MYFRKLLNTFRFYKEFLKIKNLNNKHKRFEIVNKFPIIGENTDKTFFDKHYIYHIAWAARKLREIQPQKHIDISSSLYFSSIVSAFVNTEFYDYRPPEILLDNLKVSRCDLTNLHFSSNSIFSLSCMHVVEHIGLGRYGDPINYDGDLLAINELKRVLKKGGYLLFVVPIGKKNIIYFNAHRIYTFNQIKDYFSDLELLEFTFITSKFDNTGLIKNPSNDILDNENYGCGCFLFKKLS